MSAGSCPVEALLQAAARQGIAPASAFGVLRGPASRRGAFARRWVAGVTTVPEAPAGAPAGPPTRLDTPFDLASLTKPLTTLVWCLGLVDAGRLDLDSHVGDHLDVGDARLAAVPVWRLLDHTSGLPAHRRYYESLGTLALRGDFPAARRALESALCAANLQVPAGQRERYSDLGFLLLERICAGADAPLSARWSSLPGHGPEALHFRPLSGLATPTPDAHRYAPTERCPWRRRLLRGEVHDDNAWVLGGIAGHAGLFGTLQAVLDQSLRFLDTWHGRGQPLGFSQRLLRDTLSPRRTLPGGTWVLGWDTPSPGASTSGRRFGSRSVGHLGFTGTSIWIDLRADVLMVLLTNRICPSRTSTGIRALRPAIHDAAWALLDLS